MLGLMSKESFQIAYDGPILREGSMDVYDLAPALIALGDLVSEVNRELNGDNVKATVEVQSNFKTGSFEISLYIDQSIIDAAKMVFLAGSLVDAQALAHLLFGGPTRDKIIDGLFKLYKRLKGEKPDPTKIQIKDSLIVFGDVNTDIRIGKLYLNDQVRRLVDRVVRPVAKNGIDKLETRRDNQTLEEIAKDDLPSRVLAAQPELAEGGELSNTREALLKVVTANFGKGKWRFSDGAAKFSADIEDRAFRQRLDNREIGFYKGDSLRVMLRTSQVLKQDGKISTKNSILEVIELRESARQPRLEAGFSTNT